MTRQGLTEQERKAAESDFSFWMARRKELEQRMWEIEDKIARARRILDDDFRLRASGRSLLVGKD